MPAMPPACPGELHALRYIEGVAIVPECPRLARGIVTFFATVAKNVRLPRASRGHLESAERRQGTKPSREIQCMQCQHFARLRSRPRIASKCERSRFVVPALAGKGEDRLKAELQTSLPHLEPEEQECLSVNGRAIGDLAAPGIYWRKHDQSDV